MNVYLWSSGVYIKGDFILQLSVQFLYPGISLAGRVNTLSF